MEDSAYLVAILAGSVYMLASYRLLRLSRITRERPELLLGLCFAATGQYYLIYNSQFLFGFESLHPILEHWIEWSYVAGVVPYLLFIRSVFRPNALWANALMLLLLAFLLTGVTGLAWSGEWALTLDNPWFVVEWIGYSVPGAWLCAEAAASYLSARKRCRIGLCDPVVANRFLLISAFGFFQIVASAAELVWAHENGTLQGVTWVSDAMLGGAEIASIAILLLAFFPTRFYRDWITRRAVIKPTPMDG
jgi:hypothetical protein